jgi:hypothetical protein
MKSISSLATIALLLFACKLCSLTGTNNPPVATPTPTPRPLLYAGDLIKQRLGTFTLVRHSTREEMRTSAPAFGSSLLDKSNDAGVGEYRSDKSQTVLLSVFSFSTRATADSAMDEFERDMRQSKKWTLVKTDNTENGKRLESLGVLNRKSSGMVLWNNGQWLFMTLGDGLSEARSLADAVGY